MSTTIVLFHAIQTSSVMQQPLCISSWRESKETIMLVTIRTERNDYSSQNISKYIVQTIPLNIFVFSPPFSLTSDELEPQVN